MNPPTTMNDHLTAATDPNTNTAAALEFNRQLIELEKEEYRYQRNYIGSRRWIGDVWRKHESTRKELRQQISSGVLNAADALCQLKEKLDATWEKELQWHADLYIKRGIPAEYREQILRSRLPNPRAFDEVLGWFKRYSDTMDYTDGGRQLCDRGIIAVGATGQAKTRALVYLLIAGGTRKECGGEHYWDFDDTAHHPDDDDYANSFLFLPATQLKGAAINAVKPGTEKEERAEAQKLIEMARICDVLLLDDLSHPKLTAAYAETFYEIIEHRTSHRLLNFVTLQLGRDEFLDKVSDKDPHLLATAEAIFRRLMDYCDVIDFDDAKGTYDHDKWLADWIAREGWNEV